MKTTFLRHLKTEMASFTVFRPLLSDGVIRALYDYMSTLDTTDQSASVLAYSDFVSRLYEANGGNLSLYVDGACGGCENIYVKLVGRGERVPKHIEESAEHELDILNRIAALTSEQLCAPLEWDGFLPGFVSENLNIAENFKSRIKDIGKYGYGKYAMNRMFCIDRGGEIIPVKNPDESTLDSFVGYERERGLVVENTKALLCGKPAANILLTGDAGTGKSTTVKAVGNAFYSEGLRIIEVRKEQIQVIPEILDELAQNPLKFILFIDDLSFLDGEDFNGLKAILEGSVSARSKNVVIYATSNRRHIVKESFSDRDGDDIHRNDTMQELISLSDRFGLHISFGRPDKKTYLEIVKNVAVQNGIKLPDDELESQAERFALERGGRSARLAKQFVDSLMSKE